MKKILLFCYLLGVLFTGAGAAFIWRVTSSPLNIDFAKPYIQQALHDEATGSYVIMDDVVLHWPQINGPLYLGLAGVQLMNKHDEMVLSIDDVAVSVVGGGLLSGRLLPKEIVLKQPVVRLIRTPAGDIDFGLGLGGGDNGVSSPEQHDITTRIFAYIARPGQESAKRSIISHLQSFRIENARLVIDDQMVQRSWTLPDFNAGIYSTHTGLVGRFRVKLPDIGTQNSMLRIDMNYIWDQKNVTLSADLDHIDLKSLAGAVPELSILDQQDMIINAHADTRLGEDFMPKDVNFSLSSDAGVFRHPDVTKDGVPYRDFALRASYDHNDKTIRVDETSVMLNDTLLLHAQADIVYTPHHVYGPAKIWIDSLKQEDIAPLWPEILKEDNSKKWIVDRMSEGIFKDMSLDVDIDAVKYALSKPQRVYGPLLPHDDMPWTINAHNVLAQFAFEDMTLDYNPPLDAGKKLYGSGRFDLNADEITIDITKGYLGNVPISKAHMVFDYVVAVGKGGADLNFSFDQVSLPDVLRFVSQDPINLNDDLKMDIDKVKGATDLSVGLKFPTQKGVKIKDFTIDIAGKLYDVVLPDVLDTLDLSGGPYEMTVKDGKARLKGDGFLEKRPITLSWRSFLYSEGQPYKEKITASITADPNLRTMLGIDVTDFIEGSLPLDVVYTKYQSGKALADITLDVTPALFFVEPFGFEKKSGEQASATMQAHFNKGEIQKITKINAKGQDFSFNDAQIFFKTKQGKKDVSKGDFPNVRLGQSVGATSFSYDDAGTMSIDITAKKLDARPFLAPQEVQNSNGENDPVIEEGAMAMDIRVKADTMITAPNQTISDVRLMFDIDAQGRFNHMEIDAVAGTGKVMARFQPDKDGQQIFYLKSDDAGAFLRAFEIYNNIREGMLVIYGIPMRGLFDRNLHGKAELTNFRVVKAPGLTKLLSVMSLTGIGEVLAGEGLSFKKLETKFRWLYRRKGSVLELSDGRTSGNALGLLFDGSFDNAQRSVNVAGTVVPMDGLNKVIGAIPIVGDILTGGSGGVFAAAYTIKGSFDDPKISVNPLSVLAPGIVRKILFE